MSTQYSFSQQVNDAYQLQTYLTGAIGSISYINYSPDTQGVVVYTTAPLTSGQASSLTAAMSAYPNPEIVPVVTSSFSLAFNTLSGSALSIGGPYASISGFLAVGTDVQANRNIAAVGTVSGTALNVTGQYASISGFVTVGTDLQVNRNFAAVGTVSGTALNVTGQYASVSGFLAVGTDVQVNRNIAAVGTVSGTALNVTGQYASVSGFLTVGTDLQVKRNFTAVGTATGTALNVTGPFASISGFLTVGTDVQINRNLAATGSISGTALTITGSYASVSGSVGIGTNLVVSGTGTIAQTLNTGPLTVNQSTVQNTLTIDCRSSQTLPGTMIFANTAGTGDLKITSDGGDIQWQGGGNRSLQMGAYHGILLLGGRVTTAALPQINGSGSLFNTTIQNTSDSIVVIAQGLVGQVSDLQRWQDASGKIFTRVSAAGQVLAPGFTGSNLTMIAQTVSALPVSPAATLYIDPADNVMKTVNSAGRVTTYSPETTVGDITVYNGTTQVRLPVGTNESSLIADSTQTVGMRWSPTFGSEFQNLIDSTSVQTSGTTFQTKSSSTLTTTSLVGGNYMVGVRYNYKVSNYIYNVEIRALMDGSVWHDNVTTSVSSRSSLVVSDWTVLNLSAGVHTMTLQYRVVDWGVSVTVPSSSFCIYRAEQI
ncbi:g9183 [Coccomyxa elongata]